MFLMESNYSHKRNDEKGNTLRHLLSTFLSTFCSRRWLVLTQLSKQTLNILLFAIFALPLFILKISLASCQTCATIFKQTLSILFFAKTLAFLLKSIFRLNLIKHTQTNIESIFDMRDFKHKI